MRNALIAEEAWLTARPGPGERDVVTMVKESSYKWTVLLIACIGSMMGPLDSTIVSVSLPTISQSLGMDFALSVWIPTAYLVTLASLLLTFGRLSDVRGRKPLFIAGFGVFVLGSFLCSFARSGEELIIFRIVQGLGAAGMMSTATALVTGAFPPNERGKALGINAMSVYIGLTLGPPLGGILTQAFGWPSIFLVNVPIGLLVMALAAWKLKEPAVESSGKGFDLAGAVTFAMALVTFLVALTIGDDAGWTSSTVLSLLAVTAASLAAFILAERRKGPDAMLHLDLITRNRLFAAANISTLLNYTAYFGVSFIIAFYMERVLGLDLYTTGLVLLSMPLVMSVLSPLAGHLSDKIGSRALASGGMLIVALGLALLATLGEGSTTFEVVVYLVITGIGMGLFSSPNTSAVMGCVERSQLGVASGTLSTMRTIGQSLSLAVMGAVMASVASTEVVSALFSGAMDGGSPVIIDEFVRGMSLAFLVSAGIAVAAAITSLARGKPQACEAPSGPRP